MPRRPSELRVRTLGTAAIYGENSPDYLHAKLNRSNRKSALNALGVSGDPRRSELVARLKDLRDASEKRGLAANELTRETGVVYKALARSLTTASSRSDLSEAQLRAEFQDGQGLIFTKLGWRPPQNVLAGPPIFGGYRAYSPAIAGAGRLWSALKLKEPSLSDCLQVIRKIARRRRPPDPSEETILLETLRVLAAQHAANRTVAERRKLAQLPLWTRKGWERDRPVYATDDPLIAEGLRDHLPIWKPGGELEQFRPLLDQLRVKEIRSTDAKVIDPNSADEFQDRSDLFRSALQQLHEDLARNDPQLAQSVKLPWDSLSEFSVRVHPSLALRIPVVRNGTSEVYECEVAAKVDTDRRTVFVRDPLHDLPHVDRGGRALATLFGGNPRRLAQAWRVACDRAEAGCEARPLELAQQRVEREKAKNEVEIERRTAAFQERTSAKHRSTQRSRGRTVATPTPSTSRVSGQESGKAAVKANASRVLVDPRSLRLLDPRGRITEEVASTRRRSSRGGGLVEPRQNTRVPCNRTPIRRYSDLDKETVGLELVRMLLSSDREEIVDLRAQRRVGADAIDELQRFYELKVSAGAAPDQVTLTNAEVKRALSTPGFFLVVVSGIEGVNAQPTVRVFVDPLKQLPATDSGAITLSGVCNAKSLAYDFVPIDEPVHLSEEE